MEEVCVFVMQSIAVLGRCCRDLSDSMMPPRKIVCISNFPNPDAKSDNVYTDQVNKNSNDKQAMRVD
jgi:hypothetical protein